MTTKKDNERTIWIAIAVFLMLLNIYQFVQPKITPNQSSRPGQISTP